MDHSSATLRFALLGGDVRQNYLANFLCGKGYPVTCFRTPELPSLLPAVRTAASLSEALAENTVIVGPVPFSRDGRTLYSCCQEGVLLDRLYPLLKKKHILFGGSLPAAVTAACGERETACFDLMESEALAHINAEITAEGMLCEIFKNTPFTLRDKQVLVIGYGKCGSALAQILADLGCTVGVCELVTEKKAQAAALGFQTLSPFHLQQSLARFAVIINTVPSLILNKDTLSHLMSDVFLFDLSSPPGGIDFEAAREHQIPVFHCLGLPGKIAPLSAGEAIGRIILERVSKHV